MFNLTKKSTLREICSEAYSLFNKYGYLDGDDLLPEELDAFEMNLDETAFPFEEKAISVHEKNIEMLHAGVFNEWTEKSLGRLTDLMPGRYAKYEMSSNFLGVINSYVYRTPAALDAEPAPGQADTVPGEPDRTTNPTPMAANNGGGRP